MANDLVDGHYEVHKYIDGQDHVEGHFDIKDGAISFPSPKDEFHVDRLPVGPMSTYTRNLIRHLMTEDKDTRIVKV